MNKDTLKFLDLGQNELDSQLKVKLDKLPQYKIKITKLNFIRNNDQNTF